MENVTPQSHRIFDLFCFILFYFVFLQFCKTMKKKIIIQKQKICHENWRKLKNSGKCSKRVVSWFACFSGNWMI